MGSRAHFFVRSPLAEPKIEVVQQLIRALFEVSVQHNVRITFVEMPMPVLRPRHDLELLNTPDPSAWSGTSALPRFVCFGGGLAGGPILGRRNVSNVNVCLYDAVGNVEGLTFRAS